MPTNTFELRFLFEFTPCDYAIRWKKSITDSSSKGSSNWLLTLTKYNAGNVSYDVGIEYDPGCTAWKEAIITIRQHGKIILDVLFTNDFPNVLKRSAYLERAHPEQIFHATVTETYDNGTVNNLASTLQRSSVDITDGMLDSGTTQVNAKPENNFDQPNELFNTALVIGEKKVYVNKDFLAVHSLFFEKLFFGEFAEKDKSEVVLKDLYYDQFVEFLRVIHPDGKTIATKNVKDVLFVANFVQCAYALKKCERFLVKDESFSMLEKLCLADKYELTAVMDTLLDKMTNVELQSCRTKENSKEFSNFLKARIYDKLCQ